MDPLAEEIARLRAKAAPPDALAEIAALRARLARLEAVAQSTGDKPMDLEQAVAGHYSATPPDPERKQLASIAHGFIPDPQSEDALKARGRMGAAAFDAAQRAMHADGLALSLYSRQREAAVKLGTFVPDKEGAK